MALAMGLMAHGHKVQLVAPVQFADMAAEHGVPFAELPGEFLALLDTREGKDAVAGSKGFGAGFKLLKHVRPLMMRLLDEEWRTVRSFQPDVLVYHPKSFGSPDMATALGVLHVLASPSRVHADRRISKSYASVRIAGTIQQNEPRLCHQLRAVAVRQGPEGLARNHSRPAWKDCSQAGGRDTQRV